MLSKYDYFNICQFCAVHGFNVRVLSVFLSVLFSSQVFAAAGDVISNTATVDFVYQGSAFVQESSPSGNTVTGIGNGTATSFVEDRLINFSVVSSNTVPVDVASPQPQALLEFSVSNSGNAHQDFLLTAINTSPSPIAANTENFDPVSPMLVYVEDGTNAGYQPAEDTAVFVDELMPGTSVTVYVVVDIPVVAVADAAAVALIAQVAQGGAVGQGSALTSDENGHISPAGIYSNGAINVAAGVAGTVPNTDALETVFNDPAAVNPEDIDSASVQDVASNGQHSDTGLFLVQSVIAPVVSLNKTVTVIDTLGGTDPHAGATLRYQIDVVVAGVGSVNNLVITDAIPANTTYVTSSLLLNGVVQTEASDAPIDYSIFNGSTIVVDLSQAGAVSVAPATPNLITFDVTID
ncbi:MAG: hypothetical protein OEZ15_01705 [Gammaproteobacteria bacterium]|nr:hypothetical protein [Gammaproteobacteria bacterium]